VPRDVCSVLLVSACFLLDDGVYRSVATAGWYPSIALTDRGEHTSARSTGRVRPVDRT
jgi:hypothetical protein